MIDTLSQVADGNPLSERHCFLLLSLKSLFLRINELSIRHFCKAVFGMAGQRSFGEASVLTLLGKAKR